MFLVQVEYGTTSFGLPSNPLNAAPEISYGNTDASGPYFMDHSTPEKKRCVNTAGDPFETFLKREDGELTINITVNESSFDPITMDAFKHSTNAAAVTIDGITYAENTLKLSPPTATKITETVEGTGSGSERFTYYKVVYTLEARAEGWDDTVLDVGQNELIKNPAKPTEPGKLRPIVHSVNAPVKKPWPLADGRKKPSPTATPDELKFKPYKAVAWSTLKPFKAETWANA